MLDLNVNGSAWEVSVDSICDETSDHQLLLTTKPRRQDSGTSISSVVNVVDESPAVSVGGETGDSGSNLPGAILDRGNCGEASYARSIELVTRELFPVSKGEMEKMSCEIESQWLNLSVSESVAGDSSNKVIEDQPLPPPVTRLKKSRRGPRSRSSQYRGVTFYRRTGRWESHIWDCGKQVYLGGFDTAHAAARAYDRAALKFRGASADINFTASDYEDDLKQTKDLTKIEFVHILRRQSNGLSRGSSKYRGVTLYKNSRWGTQMDQFLGKKDCNEAAAVACIGPIAQTNLVPIWDRNTSLANRNQEAADTHHNLDLSLGITPLSSVKGGNNSVRSLHLHDASYHLSGAKRTKAAESFVPASTGRQTPHYIPSWSRNHSGLAPNCEETAMKNMQPQVVPSHGVSNWAWQRNSQGMAIPLPSSSRAASSGFSPTTMWEFQPPSYH